VTPVNDLAVLKADVVSSRIYFSKLNSAGKGARVIALGYPLVEIQGQEQKAYFGYINALIGVRDDPRFIQFDASIQPGNSVDPILNYRGQAVGIVASNA